MSFNTSVNIERDFGTTPEYIVTANAKQVVGMIANLYQSGIHSFCLIGSYGTGKSSFILALENALLGKVKGDKALVKNRGIFKGFSQYRALNIVGDYQSLKSLLASHLHSDERNVFDGLEALYDEAQSNSEFLIIVIDEFGKVLEHAAKNNPEQEMYFLQQFCEWVNSPKRNVLFLCTLHQGFGAYAKGLRPEQRQEWQKVKGRLHDIVFSEPIEQLLNLAATKIEAKPIGENADTVEFIYTTARNAKICSADLKQEVAAAIYPMDVVAGYTLTLANQRLGQNERTLFTFLESKGPGTLSDFSPSANRLYSLAEVYDYIQYNFHSRLQEVNEDSANWAAIKVALERVAGQSWEDYEIKNALLIVKAVGLLNIFASQSSLIDLDFLVAYSSLAMGIKGSKEILEKLVKANILRFAKYKGRYILYDGTDVDIEGALFEASSECKRQDVTAERLNQYLDFDVRMANAHYFRTGTPRYFQTIVTDEPVTEVPKGEIDGYINIVIGDGDVPSSSAAILYGLWGDTNELSDHLFEIDKLHWIRAYKVSDDADKVANREITKLIEYEKGELRRIINEGLYSGAVEWWYKGQPIAVSSPTAMARQLSAICDEVYSGTPNYHFELINKTRPTGNMSLARQLYLQAVLDKIGEIDLGFPKDKFPPEKSIYLTLLKNTGIHSEGQLGRPSEESFIALWDACEEFLKSTTSKAKKVSELYQVLSKEPFRLKQGLLDCWLPMFLLAKKDDYALYSEGRYVPTITKETLDLLLRTPSAFSVKAFSVDGVKGLFFDRYREAINLSKVEITTGSFIETIRPFLTFYKRLNKYAKTTKDITPGARKFRDVLATATDPEKVFFETLPEELGFKEIVLTQNPEAIESFVDVLHDAIRDLRSCYDELIRGIEKTILETLRIPAAKYQDYSSIIKERYAKVKTELMPLSVRNFYNRLVGTYDNRTLWIEAICYSALNKPLTDIKDSEKEFLAQTLRDLFFQLDDYVEMHKASEDNVVRLHITQNKDKAVVKQVLLPKAMQSQVDALEQKLETMLIGDDAVNVAALISLLKKKLK